MKKISAMIALLFLVLGTQVSLAVDVYKPEMKVAKGHINDFKFEDDLSLVRVHSSGLGTQSTMLYVGSLVRAGWKLYIENREIQLKPGGGFRFEIALNPGRNIHVFKAVGPDGSTESEEIEILEKLVFSKLNTINKVPEKKLYLFPGLSFSSIQSTQTERPDYSTFALTGKISLNYRLVPRKWDLGMNIFGTVLQFTKSSSLSARYLGANARVGYFFPQITSDLFISLYAGYYFTTTYVTNNQFGYKNLGGPQLYPSIRKVLSNGNVLSGYFKFSPVASSLSLLTLSNREIAGGLSYIIMLPEDHSVGISFDYSTISLTVEESTTKTNALSLVVQYGL